MKKALRFIVFLLIIIGAINWGLVGFFGYNLVSDLFGEMSMITRTIYGIVGLCGLYSIICLCKMCCCCSKCGPDCKCHCDKGSCHK